MATKKNVPLPVDALEAAKTGSLLPDDATPAVVETIVPVAAPAEEGAAPAEPSAADVEDEGEDTSAPHDGPAEDIEPPPPPPPPPPVVRYEVVKGGKFSMNGATVRWAPGRIIDMRHYSPKDLDRALTAGLELRRIE